MPSPLRQFMRSVSVCVLIATFAASPSLSAQTHVVAPAELRQEIIAATSARELDLKEVREFLSSPGADKVLRSVHLDPARVKTAVATLSDQELAQLASRAEKAHLDFAAGTLSDRDLLIIIVGIAALILIIVAVR